MGDDDTELSVESVDTEWLYDEMSVEITAPRVLIYDMFHLAALGHTHLNFLLDTGLSDAPQGDQGSIENARMLFKEIQESDIMDPDEATERLNDLEMVVDMTQFDAPYEITVHGDIEEAVGDE